jgi:hypothetical protein
MLKHAPVAAVGALAVAVLVAATPPATAASCKAGYEPVKIQGNWVCRLKTPKLPLKAKQNPRRSETFPKHIPVESYHWGSK